MDKKRKYLTRWILALILSMLMTLPAFAADECTAAYGKGANTFRLATGSPGELGMLKAIAEVFNSKNE